MNDVLNNIYSRRSVRSYTDQPVAEGDLKEIVRAGFYAPNGMNVQALRFVIVTNPEAMLRYGTVAKEMSRKHFQKVADSISDPAKKEGVMRLVNNLGNPSFNIFYNARALVLVFTAPHALTPNEDGSLAAENMMLAASSLGIGSCWIGFAMPLGQSPEIMGELDVPVDHKLIAPIIFGYPKKVDMAPSQRMEVPIIKWVK
jgi:nitroreductase